MSATSAEWDAKHREAKAEPASSEAVILRELLPLLPRGPALDMACGRGRNTFALAARGQTVTAVDWSPVALEILEERARTYGIPSRRRNAASKSICAASEGIETVCADLTGLEIARGEFSLIVCVNYLERSLFQQIGSALKPGGALLYETYTVEQIAFAGGPRNPDYLLAAGELRGAFPDLEIVFYRELRAGQGIATLLAQKRVA